MDSWQEIRKGIRWISLSRSVVEVINFVAGTIILMRVLSPSDFGSVAMVTIITSFAAILSDMGFPTALIQKEKVTDAHVAAVWWANLSISLFLFAVLVLSAPWIERFYRSEGIAELTIGASAAILLNAFSMVNLAMLRRARAWKQIALVDITKHLCSTAIAITLAFLGYGPWALIAKSLTDGVVVMLLTWIWFPIRSYRGSWNALKDLVGFGGNLSAFSIVNFWARQLDDFLVGRQLGKAALGYYERAYSIMMMPIRQVSNIASDVFFPTLSSVARDFPQVQLLYLRGVSAIAFVTFPIMANIAATAPDFVMVVFGKQWLPLVSILTVFCVVGLVQSVGTTVGWIYMSQGRTDIMLRYGLFASAVFIASFVIGIWFGSIESVAYSYSVAVMLLITPQFMIPSRIIELKARRILFSLMPTLALASLCGGLAFILRVSLNVPELWRLMVCFGAGVCAYFALAIGLQTKAWCIVRSLFQDRAV